MCFGASFRPSPGNSPRDLAVNDTFVLRKRISTFVMRRIAATLFVIIGLLAGTSRADEKKGTDETAKDDPAPVAEGAPVPLNKNGTVLLDLKGKRLLLKTRVV